MNKQVILCGAGKIGKQLIGMLGNDAVFCFADNYKAGQIFCGKRVISLKELQKISSDFEVIISVGFLLIDELSKQLDGLGIRYTKSISYRYKNLLALGDFEGLEPEGVFTRMFAAFCKAIKPRAFVNIGAGIGGYASIAAYFMPDDARIYAFEPISRFSDVLDELFVNDNRVDIVKKAVSDKSGTLDLFATIKQNASNIAHSFTFDKEQTAFKDEYDENCKTLVETVDTITLDDFCADKDIDLILMDIEGAELFAIEGMKKLIAKGKTTIFLELHEPYIRAIRPDGVEHISKVFKENGYNFYWCEYELNHYAATRGGKRVIPVPDLRFEHCIIVPEPFTKTFNKILEKL